MAGLKANFDMERKIHYVMIIVKNVLKINKTHNFSLCENAVKFV